ncbi:MAG: hypothetical protein RLZZ141_416 [Pseudomonadota bacterium]|jgi:hypothetical protein
MKLSVLMLLAGLSLAPAASAQDARTVCRPDLVKFCQTQMEQRDRKAVRACLIKNMDKLSETCRSQIKDMMAKRAAKTH